MFAGLTIFRTKTGQDIIRIFVQWSEFYFILHVCLEIQIFITVELNFSMANENCNILHMLMEEHNLTDAFEKWSVRLYHVKHMI